MFDLNNKRAATLAQTRIGLRAAEAQAAGPPGFRRLARPGGGGGGGGAGL